MRTYAAARASLTPSKPTSISHPQNLFKKNAARVHRNWLPAQMLQAYVMAHTMLHARWRTVLHTMLHARLHYGQVQCCSCAGTEASSCASKKKKAYVAPSVRQMLGSFPAISPAPVGLNIFNSFGDGQTQFHWLPTSLVPTQIPTQGMLMPR